MLEKTKLPSRFFFGTRDNKITTFVSRMTLQKPIESVACSLQPHILIQELKASTFYRKREIALSMQVEQKNFWKKLLLNFQLYRYPLPLMALPTRNSPQRSSWRVFINQKKHQLIWNATHSFQLLVIQKDFACFIGVEPTFLENKWDDPSS